MTLLPVTDHGNIYLLAMAFAETKTFQEVTQTNSQADAFERIHYPEVNVEREGDEVVVWVEFQPPRIIIAEEMGEEELSEGGIHSFRTSEVFWVSFDFIIPHEIAAHGTTNSWAWFRTRVKKILIEARALGKTGQVPGTELAYPVISVARRVEGPYQIDIGETELHDTVNDPSEGKPRQIWHAAWEITKGY